MGWPWAGLGCPFPVQGQQQGCQDLVSGCYFTYYDFLHPVFCTALARNMMSSSGNEESELSTGCATAVLGGNAELASADSDGRGETRIPRTISTWLFRAYIPQGHPREALLGLAVTESLSPLFLF